MSLARLLSEPRGSHRRRARLSCVSAIEQSRHLVTEIPGPVSLELTKRRAAAVSAGVGMTMPVFAARAAGGIVEDVDGNRLIDLGSGIAVTTIRLSAPPGVDG